MNKAIISSVIDRETVLDACIYCNSRQVSIVADTLMNTVPEFVALQQVAQNFVINSVQKGVTSYVRSVLKSLSLNDLDHIKVSGGPVLCEPQEWLLGACDDLMSDHPKLHKKSHYVESRKEYITSYELLEHPLLQSEVEAALADHSNDVMEVRKEYRKASKKNWRQIIESYKKNQP